MKLYELSGELRLLAELLIENGGELTPSLEDRLAKIEGDFDTKVQNIALLIREHEVDAEGAALEEKRLGGIRKAHERTARSLKDYVQREMLACGRPKIETPVMRVRVQKNSMPSVVWTGKVDDLPDRYKKVEYSVHRSNVLADWAASGDSDEKRTTPDGFEITYGFHTRIY